MREKARLEPRYADLVYDGLWFSPLRDALDAFVDSTQRHVTGEVRMRLEPGRCFAAGRRDKISVSLTTKRVNHIVRVTPHPSGGCLRRERPEDRLNWVLLRLRLVVRAFCLSRASCKILSAGCGIKVAWRITERIVSA